jgi:hypothetical protein
MWTELHEKQQFELLRRTVSKEVRPDRGDREDAGTKRCKRAKPAFRWPDLDAGTRPDEKPVLETPAWQDWIVGLFSRLHHY